MMMYVVWYSFNKGSCVSGTYFLARTFHPKLHLNMVGWFLQWWNERLSNEKRAPGWLQGNMSGMTWHFLPSYVGIISNKPWNQDPENLNNQDSMD